MVRVASLSPQQGDDDDRREDGAAGTDREERRCRPGARDAGLCRRAGDGARGAGLHRRGARGAGSGPAGAAQRLSRAGLGDPSRPDRAADPPAAPGQLLPLLSGARRTAEKALTAVIQEAYIQGVSTRAVDDLVKAMGMSGISKSQVSRLCESAFAKQSALSTSG